MKTILAWRSLMLVLCSAHVIGIEFVGKRLATKEALCSR